MKIFARCAWCSTLSEAKEDWKNCPNCGREYTTVAMSLKDFAEKADIAARYGRIRSGLIAALALIFSFIGFAFVSSERPVFTAIFILLFFLMGVFVAFGLDPLVIKLAKKKFPILYRHPFFSVELFK